MDITSITAAAASPSDGRASAINCVHASLASPNGATARRAAIRRSTTETRFVRYGLCVHGAETLLCYYTAIAIHQSRSWTELCCILDVSVAHANILPHAVNFLHLPGGGLWKLQKHACTLRVTKNDDDFPHRFCFLKNDTVLSSNNLVARHLISSENVHLGASRFLPPVCVDWASTRFGKRSFEAFRCPDDLSGIPSPHQSARKRSIHLARSFAAPIIGTQVAG
jgi:hypothetical protein